MLSDRPSHMRTVSNGDKRDRYGRFQPGNPGGPGNPNISRQASLQAAVRLAIEPEAIAKVLLKLYALALEGDVHAARLLLDRVMGKVAEAPILDIWDPLPHDPRFD